LASIPAVGKHIGLEVIYGPNNLVLAGGQEQSTWWQKTERLKEGTKFFCFLYLQKIGWN